MSNFRPTVFALATVLFGCQSHAQIPNYIPFPYSIDKQINEDTAMVVTAHPLATFVGLDVLRKGGNAIDAAVAVQFALAVVYPQAGNIGGGGFMLYRPKKGETAALDFRETAPAGAVEKMYLDSLGNVQEGKSRFGILAAGVPGTVDGMWEAHQKYGKMPWAELLQYAIDLAQKGFQITEHEAKNLTSENSNFIRNSRVIPPFAHMGAWKIGEWLIQKELAQTLTRISGGGRDGFYKGWTASLIEFDMKDRGGLITMTDLENYHCVWRKPMEFDHKNLHVITMPPPSSGGIILAQCLRMVDGVPGIDSGFQSVPAIHAMVEAERRAFADRAEYLGDPDFVKVPVAGLMDSAYLRSRMADYDPERATLSKDLGAGKPKKESEETTHYSIMDGKGNMVSVTTTLNDSYGSRCVVAGAGFILNNEMDDFSAKPGATNLYGAVGSTANKIAPGKRPLSSMTPVIILKDKKPWLIAGTPGGTTIPTSMFQLVMNLWKFKMPLVDAVQKSRFHHQWKPDQIKYEEEGLPELTLERLRRMGYDLAPRSPIGRMEAILIKPDGKLEGVADHRGDDCAGGF